jgi:hypothetical protein
MSDIFHAYVMIHNMIIENEGSLSLEPCFQKHNLHIQHVVNFYEY